MDRELLQFSELVCARICHDLGGLTGTLAGALELADGENGGEAIALAHEAATALARRLRLLRAALSPASDPLGASGIADLALGLGGGLRVDVSGLGSATLSPEQARLALAMVLLCAEALPAGGTLHLTTEAQGVPHVLAVGPRAAWPPGTAQGLAGKLPGSARELLAPFCALLARATGMSLVIEDMPPALRATSLPRLPT